MKSFEQALQDGFEHVTESSDIELIKAYRDEGIHIDTEGYYRVYQQVDEVRIEPFGEEGEYLIAGYLRGVRVTEKLPICQKTKK